MAENKGTKNETKPEIKQDIKPEVKTPLAINPKVKNGGVLS